MTETLNTGTYLRVLSKSYPMNTNMIGFRWSSKKFINCKYHIFKKSDRYLFQGEL